MQNIWDKIWRDKKGDVVVYQRPNVAIIAWAVVSIASLFMSRGKAHDTVWWISHGLLAAWCLLEIFKGVNYFRRLLGLSVLALLIYAVFMYEM